MKEKSLVLHEKIE